MIQICLWIPHCEYRSIFVLGHFGHVSPIRETLWTTFSRRWFFWRFSRSFLDITKVSQRTIVNNLLTTCGWHCQPLSDEFLIELPKSTCGRLGRLGPLDASKPFWQAFLDRWSDVSKIPMHFGCETMGTIWHHWHLVILSADSHALCIKSVAQWVKSLLSGSLGRKQPIRIQHQIWHGRMLRMATAALFIGVTF